jgi:two-component system chemotaxis sensor kinase CheA
MTDKDMYDDAAEAPEAELEEVWALFAEDGREALDLVEETLLALESNPTDAEQIARLFRGLHTFKGNARMMGLEILESLAHQAEDLVALARDEGVILTSVTIDLLLEVLDRSRHMLDHAVRHRRDVEAVQVEGLLARLSDALAEPPPSPQEVPSARVGQTAPVGTADATAPPSEDDAFFLGAVEERIDPAADPEYVRIFVEMADAEMDRLHAALDVLADADEEGQEDSLRQIRAVADTLSHAAGRMGYQRLVAMLDELATTVQDWEGEARAVGLERLALALSRELAAIPGVTQLPELEESEVLDLAPSQGPPRSPPPPQPSPGFADEGMAVADLPDAARLFRRWCEGRIQADLARLGHVVDDLERFMRQFLVGHSALAWDEKLVAEVAVLLRAIYSSCAFYRLDQAARTTLALEDLYARVAEGGVPLSEALLNLTRTYVTQLGFVAESVCVDSTPDTAALNDLLGQTEQMLHRHAEGCVQQVTRDLLDLLDIPPEFRAVMMPENLLEVSRALQAGERLYTVLADMNQQEDIGETFYEWSRSNGVRLITSVTVFRDNRTLFRFLLAAPESREVILEAFAQMDPQGRHLSLEECALREGVDLEAMVSAQPVQPMFRPVERAVETRSAISADALAGFLDSVGGLVATRATIHRLTQRLTEANLAEKVTRLVRQSGGDWEHARKDAQTSLDLWTDDLRALSHAEGELGAALDQFQETALALRARPAADILDPLQRLVQDVARHLGKMVELNVTGADIGLDCGALDVLADPVRRLVWFAVAHGIEKPVQRREAGKPMTGRVSVVVRKTAHRVQVVIEDDGSGIDPAATLKHARELGWTRRDAVPASQLSELVLRQGFGVVGGSHDVEGVDLAAVNAELQAHRGRLRLTSEPGRGTRFLLNMPLDTVVIDGMVVRVGDVHYVVPIEAVRRIVRPEETHIVRSSADGGRSMLQLEEELVPIQTLRYGSGQAPSLSVSLEGRTVSEGLLLVVEADEQGVALLVDELVGQQQVLIQPLQGHLAGVQSISGCALLGEGDVGVVLDLNRVGVRSAHMPSR